MCLAHPAISVVFSSLVNQLLESLRSDTVKAMYSWYIILMSTA